MSAPGDPLERELVRDLSEAPERLADAKFATELYRALANTTWRKPGGGEGHVSLSWRRAEEVVNELRREVGEEPLTLAQTGGEGEVSDLVGGELQRLGWRSRPLDTSTEDPEHSESPPSPPPADRGAAGAGAEDPGDWERRAHEEAEQERLRGGGQSS